MFFPDHPAIRHTETTGRKWPVLCKPDDFTTDEPVSCCMCGEEITGNYIHNYSEKEDICPACQKEYAFRQASEKELWEFAEESARMDGFKAVMTNIVAISAATAMPCPTVAIMPSERLLWTLQAFARLHVDEFLDWYYSGPFIQCDTKEDDYC